MGKKNFPPATQREFLLQVLGGEKDYKINVEKWLQKISEEKDNKELKILTIE